MNLNDARFADAKRLRHFLVAMWKTSFVDETDLIQHIHLAGSEKTSLFDLCFKTLLLKNFPEHTRTKHNSASFNETILY